MEVLLPALAELFVLIAPALMGVVGLIGSLVACVFELLLLGADVVVHGSIAAASAARRTTREETDRAPSWLRRMADSPAVRKWAHRLLFGFAGLLAVSVLLLLLVNFVFFESAVRFALSRAGAATGVVASFESAEGSLITGRLRLTGVKASRADHPVSDLDVQVDDFDVDLDVFSLLGSEKRVTRVAVSGVTGSYERKQRANQPQESGAKARLVIGELLLEGIALDFQDVSLTGQPVEIALAVDKLEVEELHSSRAAFELLFNANGAGAIDGRPWSIETSHDDGGHIANWRADGLPVATAAQYLGGPLAWMTDGTLSVDTRSDWSLEGEPHLRMDWKLTISDLRAEAPDDLPWLKQGVVKPMVAFLNRNPGELPLEFTVDLDPTGFTGTASPFAVGLGQAVREKAVQELARLAGAQPAEVEQAVKDLGSKLRGFLKRPDEE
ncbi:hypothetical protein KOR34_42980 [Posidoniimonas corsicana]|uniref:Uncharacterized protein n=1 Tax=Posidoniimonas corsicana TaxID=1938618 RepID=A0A5C5V4B3_9BACT|nr:DUF748 domain-containing protein [Posidoniimonas corsicana]TWT32535.1 hypothetical protein KOR34_42980 [Posidoniimonas corsicana]